MTAEELPIGAFVSVFAITLMVNQPDQNDVHDRDFLYDENENDGDVYNEMVGANEAQFELPCSLIDSPVVGESSTLFHHDEGEGGW